jgi:large subunit ribosomal protein L10
LALSRKQKEELVEAYQDLVEDSRGLIVTGYTGLTVNDAEVLRGKIRQAGGEFHIVKNSLIKLAMEQAGVSAPEGSFDGTTAVGFADADIPAVAKAMVELAKDAGVLQIKGGIVEGKVYGAAQIERLASLPPMPVVQAQLLGLLQAPGGQVVNALADSMRRVLNVIKAYADSETAPAAETA